VCIQLKDWEEGGYRTADKDNAEIGAARGEICIGGPTVAMGYLVDAENPDPAVVAKNKEEFFEENGTAPVKLGVWPFLAMYFSVSSTPLHPANTRRVICATWRPCLADADWCLQPDAVPDSGIRWFRTGDIGAVAANGTIKIVDRKKDLVKLQQGEYVALSKVEGTVKLVPLVENALCHADPVNTFCTVLVCPMALALSAWAKAKGIGEDLEEACKHPDLGKEILASIAKLGKGKLAKFEIPTRVFVVPPSRTWSPENDLLTAAMKLKRKPIHNAFAAEIEAMYAADV